jgi:hypothetical protein
MSNGTRLLVPIRIDALVVKKDRPWEEQLKEIFQWTNLTPDFYLLQDRYLLGSDSRLYKRFETMQADPELFMAPGVHLHFRLPRALTHGIQKGSDPIEFPRIPNRWLVQRTWLNSAQKRNHKAWLIKSDAEVDEPWSEENPGVTWPEFTAGKPAVFKSIGQSAEVTGAVDEGEGSATLKLTAIGPGDPTFSAYYPACRNVLGFHDKLTDFEDGSTELSYLVTGWYSAAADDALQVFVTEFRKREGIKSGDLNKDQREKLRSELEAEWKCVCPALADQEPPTRMVCHGLIKNVGGKETTELDEGVFPLNLDVHKKNYEVAVGEVPGEALAALFKKEEEQVDQDLLTALQADILSQDTTISDLRYQLHALRFGGVRGGTVFHVQPESDEFPTTPGEPPPQRADTGALPKPLRDELRDLNDAQAAFDRQVRRVNDCIWQHYACWYLWTHWGIEKGFGSPQAQKRKSQLDSFAKLLKAEEALLEELRVKARSDRDESKKKKIETTLKKDEYQRKAADGGPSRPRYRLTESALQPFEEPNDLIVAIEGPAMQRLNTWQEIHALPCRLSNAVAKGPTWQEVFGQGATGPGGIHSDLLLESFSKGPPPKDPDKTEGPPPVWAGNPWIPLFLVWEVAWQSDYSSQDHVIASEFVDNCWTLARDKDADGGPDLALRPDAVRPAPASPVTYEGRAILTPSGAKSLKNALITLKSADPLIKKLIGKLANLRVMSQALDGFHEALTRRRVGTRFPALEHPSKNVPAVPDPPASVRTMPSDDPFFPIRAGRLKILRLYVVDAFGQTVKLPVVKGQGPTEFDGLDHVRARRAHNTFIEGLKPGEIALRPRFATPMRLRFELESASPACGWVLPNHMEDSLAIYSASGKPLGAFQKRLKREAGDKAFYWVPFPREKRQEDGLERAWPDNPQADDDKLDAFGMPLGFRKWVRGGDADERAGRAALGAFCDWVSGLGAEPGDAFSALLNESIQATDQRVPEEDPGISVLVGRPLALVRASLRLEWPGLPAHSPELIPESLKEPVQPNALEKVIVTRGFEKVRWPVRVGDHRARNDGVVGVFKCSSSGTPEGPFYPTWGEDDRRRASWWQPRPPAITETADREKFGTQEFSLDCEAPFRLMMLMDPQARAHAAIGALPRVYLELPADISSGAKRVRDVFFQTAPVLGESDTPRMPRPSDDYGEWSWAWRPNVTTGWKEDPALIEATDRGGFSGIWPAIAEGWLKLRIASVKVVSFWVRDGNEKPLKVPANIHLAWSLQNAQAVKLEKSEDGRDFATVKEWTGPPLPREHPVEVAKVKREVKYRLTATADNDKPSWKEIKIEIEGAEKP